MPLTHGERAWAVGLAVAEEQVNVVDTTTTSSAIDPPGHVQHITVVPQQHMPYLSLGLADASTRELVRGGDTDTTQMTTSIPVGWGVDGLAVDPDARRLAAINWAGFSGTVWHQDRHRGLDHYHHRRRIPLRRRRRPQTLTAYMIDIRNDAVAIIAID